MNVPGSGGKKQAPHVAGGYSGQQLSHQCDIAVHGIFAGNIVQLGPCLVFRGTDEIKEAGLVATHVSLSSLLVERIELQQGVVVGTRAQLMNIRCGLFEGTAKIGHEKS